MPRAVVCLMCAQIERLPDPPTDVRMVPAALKWMEGPHEVTRYVENDDGSRIMVPEFDPLLEDLVARHSHSRPDIEVMNFIKVHSVDQSTWDAMDVVGELKKELADATSLLFEESTWYKDEALKCYNQHKNPTTQTGCIDFHDESKIIGRKEGMPPKQRVYLCEMCPYTQTYIAQEVRWKEGLYNPDKVSKAIKAAKRRRAMKRR